MVSAVSSAISFDCLLPLLHSPAKTLTAHFDTTQLLPIVTRLLIDRFTHLVP